MSKIFKLLLGLQLVFFLYSRISYHHYIEEWFRIALFALPILLLLFALPKSKESYAKTENSGISWIILVYALFLWTAVFRGMSEFRNASGIQFLSRELFFTYDFQAYLYSGRIGVMIKTFFGPVILLLTFVNSAQSGFAKVAVGSFWIAYVVLSVIGGGRFVILELCLYLFTTLRITLIRKIFFSLIFSGIVITITLLRTGSLNSLTSLLVGLDFAYEIGKSGESYGYFSEANIVLDVMKPMSSWSIIQYGTYLDDFLYYSVLLENRYNAYSTMFFIPFVELGLLGHYVFCNLVLVTSYLLRSTTVASSFEYLMIMGMFQSPIFWYPIFYILLSILMLKVLIKGNNYVNSTYTS